MADSVTGRPSRRRCTPTSIGRDRSTRSSFSIRADKASATAATSCAGRARLVGSAAATSRVTSAGRHVDWRSLRASTARDMTLVDRRRVEAWPAVDAVEGPVEERVGFDAESDEAPGPFLGECRGIRAGLGRSAVDDRFALESPPFPRRGFALEGLGEPFDLAVDPVADLPGPTRIGREDLWGDVGDLGDAVLRGLPPHPEPLGDLGPQTAVVERGQGALVALQGLGVEGEPAAVGGEDPVRDHDMGVQLRVELSAHVLAKRHRHDPLRVDRVDLPMHAVAGVGVVLDPVDHRRDRGVMPGEDRVAHLLPADRVEDRQRLGCRERHVEAAHRPLAVGRTQCPAGGGVEAVHQRQERVLVDLAPEAQLGGPAAVPPPRWLVAVEVVRPELLHVIRAGVGATQGRDPGRHRELPGPHTHESVHSSVPD